MIDLQSGIRKRIRNLREEQGISTLEMADKLGMDKRNYERIESPEKGHKKHLELDLLESIADALGKDMGELLFPEGIYIGHMQDNSSANLLNKKVVVKGASDKEQSELIGHLRALVSEQRQLIEEQRATINELRGK